MKAIPVDKLEKWCYYKGDGRNGDVGLFDGHNFLVIGNKFKQWVVKVEGVGDCFIPYQKIEGAIPHCIPWKDYLKLKEKK